MFQATEMGPYTEDIRKTSEGTINGKFVIFKSKIYIYICMY